MKEIVSTIATTRLTRQFTRFTRESLEQAAEQTNSRGTPYLSNHDWTRLVGWTVAAAVMQLDDGEFGLEAKTLIPETDDERAAIARMYDGYMAVMQQEQLAKYPREIEAGVMGVTGYRVVAGPECCCVVKPGVLSEVYPELVSMMDDDGLIPLKDLITSSNGPKLGQAGLGFPHKRHVLLPSHMLRRRCFWFNTYNVDFLRYLRQFATAHPECTTRLALDRDRLGIAGTEGVHMELDFWWGPRFSGCVFDTQDGVTVHESSQDQLQQTGIRRTEFWWHSDGNEKTVEIEQIDDEPVTSVRKDGQVGYVTYYAHGIADTSCEAIVHLDGACRIYSPEQWGKRLQTAIHKAGKSAIRIKTFRIDTTCPTFSQREWVYLLHYFFRSNPHLSEYFGYEFVDPLQDQPRS